uniref:T9SS type A sorting domain-containing protein n=1 Tax=Flavobacterium sp. TaxID=239 RepID=UPI00404993A9
MKNFLFLILIIFSYSSYGQCVPPNASSTGCVYNTTVNSTNGYQVVISVTPSSIIVPSSCAGGYNSNAVLNYDIQFTGSNIPSNLWNLQFSLGCDPFSYNGSFPTSGGVGSSTSTNNPYRNVSDCNTVSFASLGCDVLNITINGPGISNQTITVNCEPQSAHPAESSFGDNEWILFGYDGTNYQNYKGYYIENSLSFDSRDHFELASSPSEAPNYIGCDIPANAHSYKIKREGFPCGFYKINLLGHDRRAKLNVNSVEIYNEIAATNTPIMNIWEGFLDDTSTIEFEIRSFNGGSYGAIELENIYGTSIVWNGAENSNYNNANNWCGGVIPSSTDSVLIPASTSNNMEVNINTSITDLLLLENASIVVGDDKKLTITGNIVNNGTINANAATFYFNGNSEQLISGNGFEINEVELDNSSGLTLDLNDGELVTIVEHLIVTSGALHTNNQIYLPCDYLSASDVCSFITDVNSTNGYTVSINITPVQVITASNSCPSGYNYNIEYDYDIQFSGTNIPGSLWNLQGYLTCDTDDDSIFFSLPTSGGSGTATTTSNPYRNETDCATATVNSIGCDNISIVISGPGIADQTLNLSCDYGIAGGAAHIHAILGTIEGEITVEQCYPGTRAWRFISSSVNSSGSIRENWQENASSWNDDPNPGYGTHITGTGAANANQTNDGLNGFDWNPSGASSIFSFNNTTQGWGSISNTDSDNLIAGKPYRILIRGSRSVNIQSNNAAPTNTKIRATGEIVKGPYQVPSLSDVPGNFNFIGNPFHAQVDMQQVLDEATNVIPYVYFWDPTVASRGAYVTINSLNNTNNNLSSDANIYLEPFQAVFIQTGDEETTPVITFKESHKVENQAPTTTFKNLLVEESSFINVTLYNTASYNSNGSAVDGVRVDFSSEGNNEVNKHDALKVVNLDESISFKNENTLLSIENRNYPESSEILPLQITNYKTNEYVMKMKGTEIPGVDAFLVDYYTNTQTLINTDTFTIYTFSIDNEIVESKSPERFAIIFENEVLSNNAFFTTNDFYLFPNPVKNKIYFNTSKSYETAEVEIFNMLGQTLFNEKLNFNSNNQIEIDKISFPRGYYIIKIATNSGEIYQSKFLKE